MQLSGKILLQMMKIQGVTMVMIAAVVIGIVMAGIMSAAIMANGIMAAPFMGAAVMGTAVIPQKVSGGLSTACSRLFFCCALKERQTVRIFHANGN